MLKEDIMNIEEIKKSIDTDLEHITKQMEEDRAIKMARLAEQSVYSIGRYEFNKCF